MTIKTFCNTNAFVMHAENAKKRNKLSEDQKQRTKSEMYDTMCNYKNNNNKKALYHLKGNHEIRFYIKNTITCMPA